MMDQARNARTQTEAVGRSGTATTATELTEPAARGLRRCAYAACGWALFYAAYRAYYAFGGTVGMFGVPVSEQQWRQINAIGAVILLIVAVIPLAFVQPWGRAIPLWLKLAAAWTGCVGAVMHAIVDMITRSLDLAGIIHLELPFFSTVDVRAADLQDLLFNEPWFLIEGILLGLVGWYVLRSEARRRLWVLSAIGAIAVLSVIGVLSSIGVIGRFVVG
jgi:hypothetical protein